MEHIGRQYKPLISSVFAGLFADDATVTGASNRMNSFLCDVISLHLSHVLLPMIVSSSLSFPCITWLFDE
jgi:hypothetical protein